MRSSYDAQLALGDIDGDGDVDLVQGSGLLVNLHRHAHAPYVARPGRPWELDAWSSPGYATGSEWALPLLATGPGRLALPPWGWLALDPATLVVLPPVPFPAGGGKASLGIAVPNQQALDGMSFSAQCLLVPVDPLAARFTNALRIVVRRV